MTIITEIDLRFKSGNDVQVQDVRLTREEWAQVKAYICAICEKPLSQAEADSSYLSGIELDLIPGLGYFERGKMITSTLVIERKSVGLGWSHFRYAGDSIGEAMAMMVMERTEAKNKGIHDKFRIVRVTREILTEPTE